MDDLKERLRVAEAKLAVAREALKPLANVDLWIGEDQVTGDEIAVISVSQIIKARQALKELDADRKAAMDELIAMSAEELDND